jgi:hypothetical protein
VGVLTGALRSVARIVSRPSCVMRVAFDFVAASAPRRLGYHSREPGQDKPASGSRLRKHQRLPGAGWQREGVARAASADGEMARRANSECLPV